MTYTQLRRHLSAVAKYGDDGAPNSLLPAPRWHALVCAGCVELVGGLWVITARGWSVLEETTMPAQRPADRPVQRQSRREGRQANHPQARSA